MPLIHRMTPTHDSIPTVSAAEMAKLLDAIPLENRPRIGSNARAGYLTGKFLIEVGGKLVGCDINSDANYSEALAIIAKERPAPSLLPGQAQAAPRDFGDQVVAELRAQGWFGSDDETEMHEHVVANAEKDFGDLVAEEFMKRFGKASR
jgi:hypothetical protein